MKNIVFTGGGSGGHVMPSLTLIDSILKKSLDCRLFYIGSINGIEKELLKNYKEITYYSIQTGKMRRYLSFQNITDILRVFTGIMQSIFIVLRFPKNNSIFFSTGGFVSLPVVIAASLLKRKVFIHEQTSRAGLANKIAGIFADKIFISFEASREYFKDSKTFFSGYPLREGCFSDRALDVTINNINLNDISKPILFITGGGNGSHLLNMLIKKNLETLIKDFFILHQVGKNYIEEFLPLKNYSYLPVAFIKNEIIDIYKLAKVTISRAGAGTVCELLALQIPSIFIPLKIAQKNEQFFNAKEAHDKLGSLIISEDNLEKIELEVEIKKCLAIREAYNKKTDVCSNATELLIKELLD